jgi:hypothetical protein
MVHEVQITILELDTQVVIANVRIFKSQGNIHPNITHTKLFQELHLSMVDLVSWVEEGARSLVRTQLKLQVHQMGGLQVVVV